MFTPAAVAVAATEVRWNDCSAGAT